MAQSARAMGFARGVDLKSSRRAAGTNDSYRCLSPEQILVGVFLFGGLELTVEAMCGTQWW